MNTQGILNLSLALQALDAVPSAEQECEMVRILLNRLLTQEGVTTAQIKHQTDLDEEIPF